MFISKKHVPEQTCQGGVWNSQKAKKPGNVGKITNKDLKKKTELQIYQH